MAGGRLLCPVSSAGLWQGLMTVVIGVVYFPQWFAQNVLRLLLPSMTFMQTHLHGYLKATWTKNVYMAKHTSRQRQDNG